MRMGTVIVLVIGSVASVFVIAGCAAGRGPGGEIIVGCSVARLVETPGEALSAATGVLPPPWNFLATGAGALLLGGTGAAAKYRADAKAARAERAAADAAYDEGHGRALATMAAPARPQ